MRATLVMEHEKVVITRDDYAVFGKNEFKMLFIAGGEQANILGD